jgi:NET1-associated nuclear protein 1 (U3 small nucleolar RNA-associated protein 17)
MEGPMFRAFSYNSTCSLMVTHSYFFSIVGSNVKIYSSATGEVVSTLSCAHPRRHLPPSANEEQLSLPSEEVITAAVLNPCNHFQLITASSNGCVMVWDFLEATLLQVFDLEQPITHLCAHEKFDGTVFVGASRPSHKKSTTGSWLYRDS